MLNVTKIVGLQKKFADLFNCDMLDGRSKRRQLCMFDRQFDRHDLQIQSPSTATWTATWNPIYKEHPQVCPNHEVEFFSGVRAAGSGLVQGP